MSNIFHVGDRILLRGRPWRIKSYENIGDVASGNANLLTLAALDEYDPSELSIAVPPDEPQLLSTEKLIFNTRSLDSYFSWSTAHRLLSLTYSPNDDIFSGALQGRVALEPYQFAPALRVLAKPRPRLLIADDVGLGKTVEAGLVLLELMARKRASRLLLVVPSGLMLQWQEEMEERFNLKFTLIENAAGLARVQTSLPAGVNPWDVLPRIITSVDYLKKETVHHRALRSRWDLAIVDEAHGLSLAGSSANPYATQRTRLGRKLAEKCHGLLLLTATPHNGYVHSFYSLLELVEPGISLTGEPAARARRVSAAMVRRLKSQISKTDEQGRQVPVFPLRKVEGIPVAVSGKERELLDSVSAYCARTAKQAEGSEDADLVTFAMQIIKKRASSSRYALGKTIHQRLDALKGRAEAQPPEKTELRELQADLPMSEQASERITRQLVQSSIPKEERRRKAEISKLNALKKLLAGLPAKDPKIEILLSQIREVLEDPAEKVIVFTEYADTLDAIKTALQASPDLADQAVVLRGGMSGRGRAKVQEAFEKPSMRILLATDAASEGLNLQRQCRWIFHVELPWNPNRMEQRNGRVDRYGQTRPPQIRYLYYPHSAEDGVLHRLVEKIEQMRADRVSTPDMLGILQGVDNLSGGLVALGGDQEDSRAAGDRLVGLFEDRTQDFITHVQPFLLAEAGLKEESEELKRKLSNSSQMLADDLKLEKLMTGVLGPAMQILEGGLYRIQVPRVLRAAGVADAYPQATFRRSVALGTKAKAVEFIHSGHPLVQAAAGLARARFIQSYEQERGIAPRRLACRRIPAKEPASILFTFLVGIRAGDSVLERLMSVRVGLDGRIIGNSEQARSWVDWQARPGEVQTEVIERLFTNDFGKLLDLALASARRELDQEMRTVAENRKQRSDLLLADAEQDLQGRLEEIQRQEELASGKVDLDTGQTALFASEGFRQSNFDKRREEVKRLVEQRREEIEQYGQVEAAGEPLPLGALFLVPEGAE